MRLFFGCFCCRSLCGFVDWNCCTKECDFQNWVEAFAASWIEIGKSQLYSTVILLSKPLRLRGLKFVTLNLPDSIRPSKPLRLRGLKSYSFSIRHQCLCRSLCGFVDWNIQAPHGLYQAIRRSLCGFVDWNVNILYQAIMRELSKPLRLRGLKCIYWSLYLGQRRRSLCGFVDWNFFLIWHGKMDNGRSLCGFVDWNPYERPTT